jgi:Flp pilus assembly protein CpaB
VPTTAAGSSTASKTFLIIAVALGVLATVLAFAFINQAGTADNTPKISVVVAKHDLAPNTALDPSRDLKLMQIPRVFQSLASHGLIPGSLESYKGQRINREIKADQPVMLADIGAVAELVLEKPYFALTLPADVGMIIPGDYVKIIVTKANLTAAAAAAAGNPAPASIMPYDAVVLGKGDGYKVLAVGGSLSKTRQQVLAADQYGTAAPKSVTIQVKEEDAKEIMSALGSVSNKATLLLAPSANTASPEAVSQRKP